MVRREGCGVWWWGGGKRGGVLGSAQLACIKPGTMHPVFHVEALLKFGNDFFLMIHNHHLKIQSSEKQMTNLPICREAL